MTLARGSFETTAHPGAPLDDVPEVAAATMRVDKVFEGPLTGESQVHMLSVRCPGGAAGYVGLERIVGRLDGRDGSFVVLHLGIMDPSAQTLTLEIVPGSATGELAGLRGAMSIERSDGGHQYTLDYSLDASGPTHS